VSSSTALLLVLVGTKAQFIKTAPILRELDSRGISYRLIYTGQHSETFDILESVFETRAPDDNLVPGTEADSARGLLGWAVQFGAAALKRIYRREWSGARWGVVHGDTASTLFTAVALRLAGVRVAHVEAGLRSNSLLSPFPEEIIRRLVSRVTLLHLAPDAVAVANLSKVRGRIVDTGGNSLRDALAMALQRLSPESGTGGDGGYAIVSLHRTENLSDRKVLDLMMEEVVRTSIALPVRFVLHPVTRRQLKRSGWFQRLLAESQVSLMERMDYVSFVGLMVGARFLMTDGGSNQEEAAMLGLPTLLMRSATERPDGLSAGTVVLSGLDRNLIRSFVDEHRSGHWKIRSIDPSSPSVRIVDELIRE
jgi:UDP-N-acetylglucosamine 2-epimerase (non-hydrolysing)